MWEAIFFYGFAFVAVVTALLMVLMKNPVVSAIYLIATFFCLAALYVMLDAQLLAVFQVIVYAGAIMVLFLFVIMLLNLNRTSFTSYKLFFTKSIALVVLAVILLVLFGGLTDALIDYGPKAEGKYNLYTADETKDRETGEVVATKKNEHIMKLGKVLFTRYIYPFEIMAIMLLAAVIGAVLLTKKRA
jgi:NADH-quinone oxidoreductase subunit J